MLGLGYARAEPGRAEPRGSVCLDGVGHVRARTLRERRLHDGARRVIEECLGLRDARLPYRTQERGDVADLLVRARAGELVRGQRYWVSAVVLRRRNGRGSRGSSCRTLSDRAQNSATSMTYKGTRQLSV
jgi:hypothetical protein